MKNVAAAREAEYSLAQEESLFDDKGMFKSAENELEGACNEVAVTAYKERYSQVFSADLFAGKKIVLYQHSAVGRDIVKSIFEGLGAEVIAIDRSDVFVPVDTEKVSESTLELLKEAAEKYSPFAISQPMVIRTGRFLRMKKVSFFREINLGR